MSNQHIDHLEDLIFLKGLQGINEIIFFLESIKDHFTTGLSQINITTKWDGAPSIVCGKDVYDDFFVGTKSVFNKEPKLCYTLEDIQYYYPDNEELQSKLLHCLMYLPELNIEGVLQGDMMYDREDLYSSGNYWCFKPNVIEYKIPKDTSLGKKIRESKMGIVFHTTYNNNLTEANYKVDIGRLTPSKNVWFRDASLVNAIGPQAFFTDDENKTFNTLLTSIKKHSKQCGSTLNYFTVNETLRTLTSRYVNDTIRKGETWFDISNLFAFVNDKLLEEINVAKKLETIENRRKKRNEIVEWFMWNDSGLYQIFGIYNMVISAKNLVIEKLNQMKDIDCGSYIPEGYVVSDILDTIVVKLVDRPKFSYENFNMEKWNDKAKRNMGSR